MKFSIFFMTLKKTDPIAGLYTDLRALIHGDISLPPSPQHEYIGALDVED